MKKTSIIWLVVIIVVVALAGYFWWSSSMSSYQSPAATTQTPTPTSTSPTSPTNPTSPTSPTAPQPTVTTALTLSESGSGTFGSFLSAANGMTLYQSTKDTINVSNCTGACATAWPPYTVSAAVAASLTADPGIAGKISTIKRANGSLQVTYKGLPLYFFAGDAKRGDTKGESVNGFTEVAP
jgi:predicted lipoprotein with Yx(FWY)xxD motif